MEFPEFDPHPFLRHPYLMTAGCALPRNGRKAVQGGQERRIVRVDESTRVAVDIDRPRVPNGAALLLVHGLVGSSSSGYMLGTAQKALGRGFLVARMNIRNCGGTAELTGTVYNGGLTADVEAVARELVRAPEVETVHLAGFSLGGNMVLKLAADWGAARPDWLASVATVSPCVDFSRAAEALDKGLLPRFLQRQFVRDLKLLLRERHRLDGGAFSLSGIDEVRTVRQFDDRFTAPLSGYRDADDYYARASVGPRLDRIEVPALLLTAQDDPLVPFESFDLDLIRTNARLELVAPRSGGHVGFVARAAARGGDWEDQDRFWAENRILQFVTAHTAECPG